MDWHRSQSDTDFNDRLLSGDPLLYEEAKPLADFLKNTDELGKGKRAGLQEIQKWTDLPNTLEKVRLEWNLMQQFLFVNCC